MKVPPARRAPELSGWLEANAFGLDTDSALAAEVLPRLAADGVLGVGETVLRLAQWGAEGRNRRHRLRHFPYTLATIGCR